LDPARFAVPAEVALAPEPRMQREIEYRWTKWQRDTLEPSPLIECAFARLRAECRHGLGGPALVHGDVLPHNLLVENGRVTALLDWEFAHLGDPAEDLAYLKPVIPAVMPWENFMALYVAAGGQPVDARRLAIFGLYGLVRNCSFLASAARLHATGGTDDFGMGAIGYITLPAIEAQIGAMLQAME
jgi:aminoglycoside phosphotransferase (APT) family kinase protein